MTGTPPLSKRKRLGPGQRWYTRNQAQQAFWEAVCSERPDCIRELFDLCHWYHECVHSAPAGPETARRFCKFWDQHLFPWQQQHNLLVAWPGQSDHQVLHGTASDRVVNSIVHCMVSAYAVDWLGELAADAIDNQIWRLAQDANRPPWIREEYFSMLDAVRDWIPDPTQVLQDAQIDRWSSRVLLRLEQARTREARRLPHDISKLDKVMHEHTDCQDHSADFVGDIWGLLETQDSDEVFRRFRCSWEYERGYPVFRFFERWKPSERGESREQAKFRIMDEFECHLTAYLDQTEEFFSQSATIAEQLHKCRPEAFTWLARRIVIPREPITAIGPSRSAVQRATLGLAKFLGLVPSLNT